jgi:hypothetical protein
MRDEPDLHTPVAGPSTGPDPAGADAELILDRASYGGVERAAS